MGEDEADVEHGLRKPFDAWFPRAESTVPDGTTKPVALAAISRAAAVAVAFAIFLQADSTGRE